ncbi:hypothetical protein MCUN1_003570 [Malassezia cuniculi]|uniref:Uncharacterized protein n=1 Tax=Malassezia cuniculi TaxID=948313 RepID=A0AAF0F1T0_9BASI|nr:hypothetical protein MCUN1_003570 [Malassezia cuniculi]
MSFLNAKCNAIGLTPEASLALPERVASSDEQRVIDALSSLYAGNAEAAAAILAPEAMYTAPDGSVHVGATAVAARLANTRAPSAARVLDASLPAGTIALDLATASGSRVLVVIKCKADGRVMSITEEDGHQRPARAGAAGIHSPTDSMLSPCTSKLNLSKRRHYMKGKPTALFAGMSGAQ